MNEKRKRPITPRYKWNTLLEVIAFADNHNVKNVRFHLGMKPLATYLASCITSIHLQKWAKKNGIEHCIGFKSDTVPDRVAGVAIHTPKRNCNVFVYFH